MSKNFIMFIKFICSIAPNYFVMCELVMMMMTSSMERLHGYQIR